MSGKGEKTAVKIRRLEIEERKKNDKQFLQRQKRSSMKYGKSLTLRKFHAGFQYFDSIHKQNALCLFFFGDC